MCFSFQGEGLGSHFKDAPARRHVGRYISAAAGTYDGIEMLSRQPIARSGRAHGVFGYRFAIGHIIG